MKFRSKIRALIAVSLITLGLLIYIQYELVSQNYKQTLAQYNREIKAVAVPIITQGKTLQFEILPNLTADIRSFSGKQVSDDVLIGYLARKNDSLTRVISALVNLNFQKTDQLKNGKYLFRFDGFSVQINGVVHNMLATQNKLYQDYERNNAAKDLLKLASFRGSFDLTIDGAKNKDKQIKVSFSGMQYVDVAAMGQVVLHRTTRTFLLATALLLSVGLLFYLTFSAIIRQKKISDIQTDFVNNVTHELKTPLSSASIIVKSLSLPEIREDANLFDELLGSLARQHEKIRQTVDEVLETEMSNYRQIQVELLNITDFLRAYIQDVRLEAHRLVADIETSTVELRGNRKVLEKALDNLISNAAKYSLSGTDISIDTFVLNRFYLIKITDKGIGIAYKHQRLVFDKFYRVPEQNLHTVKGLGLGLYVSRKEILQMGGDLILEHSTNEGSTFTIKLALYEN